ncbi:MAG: FkbM family methyltransferase [Nitratireductor sp.]|uniref:FkbM family methyltransferase n=1 Tax=Nitratireductor sp. TaxID=1872084 RepID=UPI002614F641|nr:FkbM family methyltransferase [Nitratireductor sp.]MCV0352775.1 FkbM family methyltransferase [Nitratireductor sp.]
MSELSRVTRDCYNLNPHVDVMQMEDELVSNSRTRRGSAKLSEGVFRTFMDIAKTQNILEVGANDGRHTKLFLSETSCDIHAFEPNVHSAPFFSPIQDDPRLNLNLFGLSNQTRLLQLNIPVSIDGRSLKRVNGVTSFETLKRHDVHFEKTVAMVTTGSEYLETKFESSVPEFALWLDVEGHAVEALEGFGPHLSQASICMCEVEYPSNLYPIGPYGDVFSADRAIRILESHGQKVIYRDFQNAGQGNIISINRKYLHLKDKALSAADEFIQAVSTRFNRYAENSV